jgi:hypothetical protein
VCFNCVDRHVEANVDRVAFHWEGEPEGDRRKMHSSNETSYACQRPQEDRRRQRNAGGYLHGHGARAPSRDARLRT